MSTIQQSQLGHLPHNNEAEQAIIGSIIIDPDAVLAAREANLKAEDFYWPQYGLIYAAALTLADRFEPVDSIGIASVLKERKDPLGSQLELIGGPAGLTQLANECPTSVYAKHYATIVRRCAQQRGIISAAGEIAKQAHEHEGPVDELYDAVSGLLFGAMDRNENESHLYGTEDTLTNYLVDQDRIRERLQANPDALMKTHLPTIDHLLIKLRPGHVHTVGAQTSVGKTLYMEQIAEANAMRGHRIAYYHLELLHKDMENRRVLRHSDLTMEEVEHGYNGPRLARAMDRIRDWHWRIIYVHCPGWSAVRIAADIQRLYARGECDLVLVDYLGMIPLPDKVWGRNESSLIGLNVATLKNVAETLAIPLVLGSQVRRDFKGNRRLQISDLRGSGEIEERSSQIVMLVQFTERPENAGYGQREKLEAYVDKNTSGATGRAIIWHRLGMYRLECETMGV